MVILLSAALTCLSAENRGSSIELTRCCVDGTLIFFFPVLLLRPAVEAYGTIDYLFHLGPCEHGMPITTFSRLLPRRSMVCLWRSRLRVYYRKAQTVLRHNLIVHICLLPFLLDRISEHLQLHTHTSVEDNSVESR